MDVDDVAAVDMIMVVTANVDVDDFVAVLIVVVVDWFVAMVNVVEVIVVANAIVVQFFVADHNHNQSKTKQIKSNLHNHEFNGVIIGTDSMQLPLLLLFVFVHAHVSM